MAIFTSLVGKKEKYPAPNPLAINEAISTLREYCNKVMHRIGEEAFKGDTMERQVLSVYSFGGLHVLAQQKGFAPPHAHAVCLVLFKDIFGYSNEESAAKAQACITAATDRTSHLNSIIHRGIDGFLAWQEHRGTFDASDFKDIIARLHTKTGDH
jgi:hypothetical protein